MLPGVAVQRQIRFRESLNINSSYDRSIIPDVAFTDDDLQIAFCLDLSQFVSGVGWEIAVLVYGVPSGCRNKDNLRVPLEHCGRFVFPVVQSTYNTI